VLELRKLQYFIEELEKELLNTKSFTDLHTFVKMDNAQFRIMSSYHYYQYWLRGTY
jgi:hypothetical protein